MKIILLTWDHNDGDYFTTDVPYSEKLYEIFLTLKNKTFKTNEEVQEFERLLYEVDDSEFESSKDTWKIECCMFPYFEDNCAHTLEKIQVVDILKTDEINCRNEDR